MKKVFIDTNVVLDYFLNRESFCENAEKILALGFNKQCLLYASSLTFSNVAYIARKKFPGRLMYSVLEGLLEMVNVSSVDKHAVRLALSLKADDFEDALQYYSAKSVFADCIVTRNTKDFVFSDIPVLTPSEFLKI